MRKLPFLFLIASLFACAAHASGAENQPARQAQLTIEQMHEIEGVYALGDGRTVEIKVIDDRLYLDVGRRGRWQLLETGTYTFTTRSDEVSLSFKRGADFDKDQIVLNYDSASRIAR